MKAETKIINWIKTAKRIFSDIEFKYAYDKTTDFHIIEIYPVTSFDDEKFRNLYLDFYIKFRIEFPTQELLFSEPHSFNDMSNLLYPIKEKAYNFITIDYTNIQKYVNMDAIFFKVELPKTTKEISSKATCCLS